MKRTYENITTQLDKLYDLPPLFFRLILAYGFYEPALKKWQNMDSIISWFSGMGIPLPTLNAYMAAGTEALGVVLLLLGLFTRAITIPLIIVMVVAILTTHIGNGFVASANGFEIPLYYMLMLFSLLITGPGRISVDKLFFKKKI